VSGLLDADAAAWLETLGRSHPLVLHLPIGALALLIVAELWWKLRRREPDLGLQRLAVAFVALSAGVAATSGWQLAEDPNYGGGDQTLLWHRWLGVAMASAATLALLAALLGRGRAYGRLLVLALVLVIPGGHLGGSMTHGEGFLTDALLGGSSGVGDRPVGDPLTDAATDAPTVAWYGDVIAPLLDQRCTGCHGAKKAKGGLALHTPEDLLAGGRAGPAIVPGDVDGSELIRRTALPLDDDDHMPPPNKGQPTQDELALLRQWVAAGAPFEGPAPADAAAWGAGLAAHEDASSQAELLPARVADDHEAELLPEAAGAGAAADSIPQSIYQAPAAAVVDLRAQQVHVEVLDPATGGLWVHFGAAPPMSADALAAALAPVADGVLELSLAGTAADDELLQALAPCARLETLDLSHTQVTAEGLVALASLPRLSRLTLTGTSLGEGAVEALAALPGLSRISAWDAGLPDDAGGRLAEAHPGLQASLGLEGGREPLELEPEVVFGEPSALSPVNAVCPVSGGPVDPAFSIVHDGQVVGFCCNECPSTFWDDPAAFPVTAAE
jgi:uncharacterized membrane protein/YHS domain-containing protein